jgi:RNA-binding protein
MPTLNIAAADRRELKSLAHHLDPVVIVGQKGLTPSVLHEIDNALAAHELIKVRIVSDERDTRADMLTTICETLSCASVQQVGKMLVLFRPGKDNAAPAPKKKDAERPRHTDFPKAPPRARQSADTRPPQQAAEAKARRRPRQDDDAWSDLSPRVRARVDPNYDENAERFSRERDSRAPRKPFGAAASDRPRPPRKTASAAGASFAKKSSFAPEKRSYSDDAAPAKPRRFSKVDPTGRPSPVRAKPAGAFGESTFSDRKPRARDGADSSSASTTRRRLQSDDAGAAETTAKKKTEPRFRWKDRDSFTPPERAPRPTTHTQPKVNKRGAARDPKEVARQTRRRLREES